MTNNTNHQQFTTELLNPSKDSVFHQLFTNPNPQSEKALKCFLEAILQEQISNIEIQREELHIEDSSLNKKEQQKDLRNQIYNCMMERSRNSNIEYIKYIKKEDNKKTPF